MLNMCKESFAALHHNEQGRASNVRICKDQPQWQGKIVVEFKGVGCIDSRTVLFDELGFLNKKAEKNALEIVSKLQPAKALAKPSPAK